MHALRALDLAIHFCYIGSDLIAQDFVEPLYGLEGADLIDQK